MYFAIAALFVLLILFIFMMIKYRRATRSLVKVEAELEEVRKLNEMDHRDMFFIRLFVGGYYHNEESIMEAANQMQFDFSGSGFIQIAVKLEEWGNIFSKDSEALGMEAVRHTFFVLRNVFEEQMSQYGFAYAIEYLGQLRCMVCLNSEDSTICTIKKSILEVIEFLEDQFSISVSVAVSRVYSELMDLPRANADVEKVFEYNGLLDEDLQVTAYEDLTFAQLAPSSVNYPQMENMLLSCIQVSDLEGARQIMHELVSKEFYETKPSIEIIKFRVYGMVNSLLHMMDEIRATIGDEFYYELNPGYRLCEAGSMEGILQAMDDIFARLIEHNREKKREVPPPWFQMVCQYVDEKYVDVNLTVASVADNFGMSPSYCSRVFKQYTGIGLLEHIQRRRIEAAKKLMDTNKSVKKISEEVGFSSPLTMNRAFKRYEGSSPSKFKGG